MRVAWLPTVAVWRCRPPTACNEGSSSSSSTARPQADHVLTEPAPPRWESATTYFVEGGSASVVLRARRRNHLYLYETRACRCARSPRRAGGAGLSGVAWVRGGVVAVDEARHLVYFTAASGLRSRRHSTVSWMGVQSSA